MASGVAPVLAQATQFFPGSLAKQFVGDGIGSLLSKPAIGTMIDCPPVLSQAMSASYSGAAQRTAVRMALYSKSLESPAVPPRGQDQLAALDAC